MPRIYEEKTGAGKKTGMICLDDDNGNPLFSFAQGTADVVVENSKINIYSRTQRKLLLADQDPSAIKTQSGVTYSGTLIGCRSALNAFFGEAPALDVWGVIGEGSSLYVNGQSNTTATYTTSSQINANTIYCFPFFAKGLITDVGLNVVSGVGKLNFGIYNSDATKAPGGKLWQIPAEINNTASNTNYTYSSVNLDLDADIYWFVMVTNATFRFNSMPDTSCFNLLGMSAPNNTRDVNRYTAALTYTATLPDPLPSLTPNGSGFNIPVLFYKKAA